MNFNKHYELNDKHAFFSPSQSAWLRYSDDKIVDKFLNLNAKEMGTRLHEWACETILLGQQQPRNKKTISLYINDAIGFHMIPEQKLAYSHNCFGTADVICFRNNFLRIHDLKNGVVAADMEQLMIYAALFCLEYKIRPADINIELRIYQSNEILIANPEADEIVPIMDRIITVDKVLKKIQNEEV